MSEQVNNGKLNSCDHFRMKIKQGKSFDFMLVISLAVYVFLAIIIFPFYQYQINADGIVYVNIAQKYLRGDFFNAINGSYGPLFSWLLIPFLIFGLTPMLAAKIVTLLAGAFMIIAGRKLSQHVLMQQKVRDLIMFVSVPTILYFALFVIVPDLLFTSLMLLYLSTLLKFGYSKNIKNGIFCGILAGLAYLAKPYGFCFFIVHFSIVALLFHWRNMRFHQRGEVRNFFAGLSMCILIVGAWNCFLTLKYEKFVLFYAGQYNYSLANPDFNGCSYVDIAGFIKPPNETAVSPYEDPLFFDLPLWNPFASEKNFFKLLKIFYDNGVDIVKIHLGFSLFAPLIIVVYLLRCLIFKKSFFKLKKSILFITFLIYTSGFFLTRAKEGRYFLVNYELLLLMAGYLLSLVAKIIGKRSTKMFFISSVFVLSCVSFPCRLIGPAISNNRIDKDLYDMGRSIKNRFKFSVNFASDNYNSGLLLSYYLEGRFFGVPGTYQAMSEFSKNLKKFDIDYFLLFNVQNPLASELSQYKEITVGSVPGLLIYAIKDGNKI